MEFGRSRFVGSLLAIALIWLCTSEVKAWGQMVPASTPEEIASPATPASHLPQNTPGTVPDSAQPAKPSSIAAAVNPLSAAPENSPLMKLGPGDLLEVGVYGVPELSTKARIGSSGDVYLPLIDYVHLAELTVEEAQGLIQKRLEDGGFVRSPHVTIFVDESTSQGVTILGEVARPGIYPALGDRKLYDLISAAGGFAPAAGRNVSIIRQRSQSGPITVNLPRNLADDLQENVEIMPGDTITVPRAPVIYVVGDVGHPTGLLVDNGNLTVLQALALAGGTNKTAKMGGTRILHKGPNGMTETRVPLKKMLEAKVPDVNLQADDILFVPLSGARVAMAKGLESAAAAATALTVIAVHP